MSVLKKLAMLSCIFICIFILFSCASNPRVGRLQGQVDDLQKLVAAKDDQITAKSARISQLEAELARLKDDDAQKTSEINWLNAKLDASNQANDDLSADIASLQSGKMKSQADYLARIAALNRDKAALQDRISELEKEKSTLEIAAQREEKDLNDRIDQLQILLGQEIARGYLEIRKFQNALIVSVKDSVLFPPDSPTLRPESLKLLRQLAEVFKKASDRIVRVEGNTAIAISSPETLRLYPTSWHLGAARAANVVQFLQEKCGMDPMQLVAVSLGEYRPRADNWTEEGKAKNRRVDFVLVAPALYENQ